MINNTNFFRKTSLNKKITFSRKVKSKSNKAQVTIFIIVAILIVSGIVLFFVFKDRILQPGISKELEPVYSYY